MTAPTYVAGSRRRGHVTTASRLPLARGLLSDSIHDRAELAEKGIRRSMPRFTPERWPANAAPLPGWRALARGLCGAIPGIGNYGFGRGSSGTCRT